MKIIFDSEKQRDEFYKRLTLDICPDELCLKSGTCRDYTRCRDCWDDSNLETEIAEKEVNKNE